MADGVADVVLDEVADGVDVVDDGAVDGVVDGTVQFACVVHSSCYVGWFAVVVRCTSLLVHHKSVVEGC